MDVRQPTRLSEHCDIAVSKNMRSEMTANLKQMPLIGSVAMSAEALEVSYWLKTERVAPDILITAIYSLRPIWQEKWAAI